ncbi:MAG: hypothetical protein HQK54_03595 [Oligoflexales bacterium]|nr:hypothetical protein [Oligoflexales bacterium]
MSFFKKTGLIALPILAAWTLYGCFKNRPVNDSGLTFNHDDLFQFQGADQDNLLLISTPLCSPDIISQKGSLLTAKDGLLKLKFYKVEYEALSEKVNGSQEGDVISVTETTKEMGLSKDSVESGNIGITPNFSEDDAMNDGHYVAVLCDTSKPCIPPSREALTAYKNKFQAGECGKASDGKLKVSCKEILFNGDAKSNYLGITYPVTVKNRKFTQGDFDFVYLTGNTGGKAEGTGCGTEMAKDNVIFESSGNKSTDTAQPFDPSQVSGTTTPRGLNPDGTPIDGSTPGSPGTSTSDIPGGPNSGSGGIKPPFDSGIPGQFSGTPQTISPPPIAPPPLPPIPPVPPINWGQAMQNAGNLMNMFSECFSKGTKIIVVKVDSSGKIIDFGQKKVEDIVEGDHIYEPIKKAPYRVYEKTSDIQTVALYRLDISGNGGNDISLTVSSAHPILTDQGLTQISNIQEGQRVLYAGDSTIDSGTKLLWVKVKRLTRLGKRAVQMRAGSEKGEKVYNFKLESVNGKSSRAKGSEGVYAISNKIVTGDLNTQMALEKMTQINFRNSFAKEE